MAGNARTYFLPPQGDFSAEDAQLLRADMLQHLRLTKHTAVATIRYRTVTRNHRTGATQEGWRQVRVVVPVDKGYLTDRERNEWIRTQIRETLSGQGEDDQSLKALSGASAEDTNVWLDPATGLPDFQLVSVQELLDEPTLRYELGVQLEELKTLNQNALFADHEWYAGQHRSFRYMIRGCDLTTLGDLLAPEPVGPEGRMCAYRMLRERNTPGPRNGPTPKIFRPEGVLKFMQEQFNVGSWTEGLTADQIQQHAIVHRYPHVAMDLSRSILNFHYPAKRHANHKSIIYVVTGDHCQPIVDEEVVQSIMKSIPEHMGVRHAHGHMNDGISEEHTGDGRQRRNDGAFVMNASTSSGTSLVRPSNHKRNRRHVIDTLQVDLGNGQPPRSEMEDVDRAEDPLEEADDIDADTLRVTDDGKKRKTTVMQYPLITDTDRFHLHPKAEMMALVEAKCHPDYTEPDVPAHHIHFYITTDEDDVNYVYHYLVRKCNIDPMKYAKAYNGNCMLVRMKNLHWVAHRDFETVRRVHLLLYPKEPFRPASLGCYAFRLWCHQLVELPGNVQSYDAYSHYSPNMARLADLRNHYNHAKILMRTFNPPYSDPRVTEGKVETIIRMSLRRRIDFIRSYTAVLYSLDVRDHDTIPIHGVMDRVVPFQANIHGAWPCGHYLVEIPTETQQQSAGTTDQWALWSCFPPGTARLMTHRLVKGLVDRGLLTPDAVRWVCTTDPDRQKRCGSAVITALHRLIETLYRDPEMPPSALKSLINHLVGCFNGTTVPKNGGRLVFRSLEHLWQLILGNLGKDQVRRLKIFHTQGFDEDWQCSYDYRELDVSGLAHRSFHLQPLWNVVLEQQALNVYDVACTIPRANLIQINVDAIEYDVPSDTGILPAWAQTIAQNTVDRETYEALTPLQLLEGGYLDGGRYKFEWPKVEAQALAYHRETHTTPGRTPTIVDVLDRPAEDTEDHRVEPDWKGALRVVTDADGLWAALTVPVTPEVCPCDTSPDHIHPVANREEHRHGCMITGAAGTGKTRALRQLVEMAQARGDRVILSAYTHAACVQMGPEAQTLSSLFGIPLDYMVRSYLVSSSRCRKTLANIRCDWLIIDEISLIPINILEVLMEFHRVHSQTRIVLVGDFNQLPPIESRRDFGEDFDYFGSTDIFPYLCYDRRHNVHGLWLQLTKCHRTDDPILRTIAENPASVVAIPAEQFPPLPSGSEVWRFLSMDNRQRKACNYYCMMRFQLKYPLAAYTVLCLRDLWVNRQWENYQRKHTTSTVEDDVDTAAVNAERLLIWGKQFDGIVEEGVPKLSYRPGHWQYLQDYTYVVGMPVACRHTLREWKSQNDTPVCVNNRRAHVVDIDHDAQEIIIRWDDEVERHENREEILETLDVKLKFYDFAFHFVPAFCTTIHWAQGETIREHYAVMDWPNVRKNKKAAYVAVTRGSAAYLHLMPYYNSDPWNTHSTADLTVNIIKELYNMYCWTKDAIFRTGVPEVVRKLTDQKYQCAHCTIDLKVTGFMDSHPQRFRIVTQDRESVLTIQCQQCYSARYQSNRPSSVVPSIY